ncbi:prenyltransferase [Halopseudomonas salegens]|uniref:1,4-dihydroxy-2-naphthoate octaprenyltransferase n=1 Tax=Halopseudomonas salegens TaxID=1434072 RepID=A0A1H2E296_9GAMM|nr:prenyltransferase [Halopseudomonas salegens]SDT89256.1 1,4-dihydroxy-2-naphthoate octaprenyltransferase [Halopseudomonas salegens]
MGILHTLRPPFLLLALVTVALAMAIAPPGPLQGYWPWVLMGAVAAHAAVNVLNEYADFHSELDLHTERTPFSGGSGYLPAHPDAATGVLWLGLALLALTAMIGLWLCWQVGSGLLPVGVVGMLLVAFYTPWITRNRWLSLLAPGIGFGLLMLLGSQYVLSGEYTRAGLAAGLVLCFLINNLLLLNQLPDCEADRQVGRDNLVVHYGVTVARAVYAGQWLLSLTVLLLAVAAGWLPPAVLVALPFFLLGLHSLWQSRAAGNLFSALRSNVLQCLLVPALMALGMWWFG